MFYILFKHIICLGFLFKNFIKSNFSFYSLIRILFFQPINYSLEPWNYYPNHAFPISPFINFFVTNLNLFPLNATLSLIQLKYTCSIIFFDRTFPYYLLLKQLLTESPEKILITAKVSFLKPSLQIKQINNFVKVFIINWAHFWWKIVPLNPILSLYAICLNQSVANLSPINWLSMIWLRCFQRMWNGAGSQKCQRKCVFQNNQGLQKTVRV